MMSFFRDFVVKYLSKIGMDELELLLNELAQLPQFEAIVAKVMAFYQHRSLQEPVVVDPNVAPVE